MKSVRTNSGNGNVILCRSADSVAAEWIWDIIMWQNELHKLASISFLHHLHHFSFTQKLLVEIVKSNQSTFHGYQLQNNSSIIAHSYFLLLEIGWHICMKVRLLQVAKKIPARTVVFGNLSFHYLPLRIKYGSSYIHQTRSSIFDCIHLSRPYCLQLNHPTSIKFNQIFHDFTN